MSIRSDALENEENHKFIDPISLDLMNDPVIASDGHSYERIHIMEWFEKAKQAGGVVLSPLTGLPLPNETLRSNLELKTEIDAFKASKSSIQTKDIKRCLPTEPSIAEVSLLSPIAEKGFYQVSALDNIREKIQDAMQFLIDNDTKKRMIIDDNEVVVKIKLPYVLNVDILDLPGLVTTARESSGQNLPDVTKRLASKIVMENKDCSIFLLVNDIRVPPNQSRGCEVIQECKVQSKTLGVFTKLDAFVSEDGDEAEELNQYLSCKADSSFSVGYGWMAASSKKMPDSTAKASAGRRNELQSIMNMESRERLLFESKYSSVNAPNVLGVLNIRQKIQNIYERFISDNWIPHILEKFETHNDKIEEKLFKLGVPLAAHPSYNNFPIFQSKFFVISITEVSARMNWLIGFLAQNLKELFLGVSQDDTLWSLFDEYHRLFRNEPPPRGIQQSSDFLSKLQYTVEPYSAYHPIKSDNVRGREIRVNDVGGQITAKITKVCDSDSFEIEQTSKLLVGQKVRINPSAIHNGGFISNSYYSIKQELDIKGSLEGTIISDSRSSPNDMCYVEFTPSSTPTSSSIEPNPSRLGKKIGSRKISMAYTSIPNSLELNSSRLGTLEVPRSWLSSVKTQITRAEIVSGLEGAILTREDLINQNYRRHSNGNSSKFDGNSLFENPSSKFVIFDKANAKKEEMKKLVKVLLTKIFEHLQMKLNLNTSQLEKIILENDRNLREVYESNGDDQFYPFNIERFPRFLQTFQTIISDRLTELRNEFHNWFINFLRQTIDEAPPALDIIAPEFIRSEGKVYCYLHWANIEMLEKLPHLILAKWSEITPERFGKGLLESLNQKIDMTMFADEPCREERLKGFVELNQLKGLKDDVTAFAAKVTMARK
eukprot:gene5109-5469_t